MVLTDLLPLAFAASCAAVLMPLAIHAQSLGRDSDFVSPQKVHDVPTSRLGGAIVVLAYLGALGWAVPADHVERLTAICVAVACLPVVLVGLREDITGSVHPWHRLAASVVSAALASWLAGGIIARLDLPLIDRWLTHLVIVLPITWFMVAGACNAINLIDGAHGLAAGTVLMMFAGIAIVAVYVGDSLVFAQSIAMVGAIAGFLVWNYPRGKVFLGDAGAYFLGFVYAELSIQIVARNPGVSAWFVIGLAAYPIAETLYSIYRRKVVYRTASMQPDAGHLHSLIFRGLIAQQGNVRSQGVLNRVNARVAPQLWLHGALCLTAALYLYDNTRALIAFTVIYTVYYVICYRWQMRKRVHGQLGLFRPHRTVAKNE